MKTKTLLTATLLLLGTTAAQAATYVATMTGVALDGVDYTRFFGGASIVGAPVVTVQVTYDLDGGTLVPNALGYQRFGGTMHGGGLVVKNIKLFNTAATLSYAPLTEQIVGAFSNTAFGQSQASFVGDDIADFPGTSLFKSRDDLFLRPVVAGSTIALDALGSYQVLFYLGSFFSYNSATVSDAMAGIADRNITANIGGAGTLSIAAFVSSPAAVPEPASWAMLLTGFGLIGAALRRRRNGIAAG